jgi:hypothetical protein
MAALLGFAGSASAAGSHALADRTYYATVPKSNVAVLVKTDPIPKNKPGGGAAKTGVVAIECGVHLARVNPTFAFTPRGSFFTRTDWFFSTWGNTGNGTFDAVGKVSSRLGERIKVTLKVSQVPTCFNTKGSQTLTLTLAGRKVTQRLAFELAQGVHTPASIAPTCPASSVFGQQVAVNGRLSPDTGGTGITIVEGNGAGGQLSITTVPTAADGSFTHRFTPSPASGPAYTETVTMNFPGGWGRDPTSARCSWQVNPPVPVFL